ncbi:MAG: hypothetical protein QOI94_243 [Acidobacteriaceae bacterium]|nr:hypothetical protein [Acidobacteriaceae bacterium]
MRFGPLTLGITAILGMVGGASGCHSSTPAAGSATFSSLEQVDKYQCSKTSPPRAP